MTQTMGSTQKSTVEGGNSQRAPWQSAGNTVNYRRSNPEVNKKYTCGEFVRMSDDSAAKKIKLESSEVL